jgi:Protein of unknown function (DUF2842)
MHADTSFGVTGASALWPHLGKVILHYRADMNIRTRKALGTLAFVLWLIFYSLFAMAIGGRFVVGSHVLIELGFYILAVVPWVIGAMIIIRWMSRPETN